MIHGQERILLECVVFDLDGLLVDSEPLQFRAYREAFARHGVEIELSDWRRWHELEASVPKWVEIDGLEVNPEVIRAEKKTLYEEMVEEELELKSGAEELVRELSEHCRISVASGSRIESIRACLEKFELEGLFESFFSGTTLARSKPFPDVYVHALGSMGVPAHRALAIEDSVQGLVAARAAELRCVVCPDTHNRRPASDYAEATLVVESLLELNLGVLQSLPRYEE